LVSKAWISKEVPLGRAVKAEMADGKVASIVTDFGRASRRSKLHLYFILHAPASSLQGRFYD